MATPVSECSTFAINLFSFTVFVSFHLSLFCLILRSLSISLNVLSGAEFVTSRRGNPMIVLEGRTFIHERSMGSVVPRTRWVCSKKRWLKCRATLTTVNGVVVKKFGMHNH